MENQVHKFSAAACQTRYSAFICLDACTRAHLLGWHHAQAGLVPFMDADAVPGVMFGTWPPWPGNWPPNSMVASSHSWHICIWTSSLYWPCFSWSKEEQGRAQGHLPDAQIALHRQLGSSHTSSPFKEHGVYASKALWLLCLRSCQCQSFAIRRKWTFWQEKSLLSWKHKWSTSAAEWTRCCLRM